MTKEYFSHDYDAADDLKMVPLIHQFKARGYGIYWMAAEMLHQNGGYMPATDNTYLAIAKKLSEKLSLVKSVVEKCFTDFDLFIQENGKFYSNRALRNLDKRKEIKEKRSKAGQASAASRQQNSTNGQHMLTHVEHNSTKERKGKEIKGKEIKINGEANASVGKPTLQKFDKENLELKKEFQSLQIPESAKEAWVIIKNWIEEKQPTFIEPYVTAWNIFASFYNLSAVDKINDSRRKKFKVRIKDPEFNFFEILAKAKGSSFLKESSWFGFDWLFKNEMNYVKILEENYQ
jgi:hypothetical protein